MGVTTLYLDDGADSNMMYMNPTGECKWFEFGHFSMDGNGSNQSDGAGRDQRSAFFINDHGDWLRMFSLSNIFVRNTRHGAGMRLFGLVFSELNFVVCNNNGIGGAAFPSDGLYMKNSERVLLSNIVSHDNSDTGVALDYSGHMQLVNIHAHGNTYQGMTMADRSHRFLVSNSIFQSSQYGLKSGPFLGSGRTHMLSISCCHFMNNTVFGLELQDHDHLTMVSSVFEGNIGDLNQINTGGTIRGRGNIPMLDFG
jgi:nitrous oxidase accessory protein NosD